MKKQWTARGTFARTIFMVVVIASVALSACSTSAGTSQPGSEQATPTAIPTSAAAARQTYKVETGDIVSLLEFSGRVVPVTEQQAFFRADGRVRKVYVKSGDTVKQGDVLADLMSIDDLQKSQRQQEINRKRAEINLAMAKLRQSMAATQTPLWQAGREAEMKMQDYQVQLAQLDFDQQQLESSNVQGAIEDAQLIAPIDGQVLTFQVREGDPVTGFEPVAVVGDLQNLEIGAQLADTQMTSLTEGKACKAEFTTKSGGPFDCLIRSLPYPFGTANQTRTNTTDNPAVAIDNSNTRITLKPDSGASLTMGDLVSVSVVLQEKKGVLLLPVSALRTSNGRNFVVIQADGLLKRVDVKTGIRSEDLVEIESGVKAGDVVVAP